MIDNSRISQLGSKRMGAGGGASHCLPATHFHPDCYLALSPTLGLGLHTSVKSVGTILQVTVPLQVVLACESKLTLKPTITVAYKI